MRDVLESAEFITAHAQFIEIDRNRIGAMAGDIAQGHYAQPQELVELPFVGGSPEETARFYLVLDSMNFCFWSDPNDETWEVRNDRNEWVSGYWAFVASLTRGIKEKTISVDTETLTHMGLEEMNKLFRGKGVIPLLESRLDALREVGESLKEVSAMTLIEESGHNIVPFIDSILSRLPSFRDVAEFRGREVGFYKRAQLLAHDLQLGLHAHGYTAFEDIGKLTVMSDYRLPQLLRQEGVLVYSLELAQLVDTQVHLPRGGQLEVEIRGSTIWASELLREEIERQGLALTSAQLDNILWTESKRPERIMAPHHRTRTIYY